MATSTSLTGLAAAVGFADRELVTVVGGGGKTTVLCALSHQLGGRRIVTTTTKMGRDQTCGLPVVVGPSDEELQDALSVDGAVVAWGDERGKKAIGVDPGRCDRLFELADYLLVEADGAAGHPFKAPRPFEPVVPSRTTTLLACIGADALGRVIADQCHRPLRVAAVAGCSPYERLTPERAARVLLDPRGSRKDCPPGARFVIVVNKVDARSALLVSELSETIGSRASVVQIEFDARAGEHEAGTTFA